MICILDLDARPWDFQAEECTLRTCVDRFNGRRYISVNPMNNRPTIIQTETNIANDITDYEQSGDPSIINDGKCGDGGTGVYGGGGGVVNGVVVTDQFNNSNLTSNQDLELSEEFKENYGLWLEQEVFKIQINWDSLMQYLK